MYNQGYDAYINGWLLSSNPYICNTKCYLEWQHGWEDAHLSFSK